MFGAIRMSSDMTRRTAVTVLASSLARAAGRLPANKNVRWALGSNLWNYFPRVSFTDILDVMRDTGFIGVRVTQFPQILTTYNITTAELEKEVSKRNLHVITISFNGPAHDASKRADVIANAKKAMGFLKNFGASRLVVFSPSRSNLTDENFKTMCECCNQLGEAAGEMGFRAGAAQPPRADGAGCRRGRQVHGHDRSETFLLLARHRAPVSGR